MTNETRSSGREPRASAASEPAQGAPAPDDAPAHDAPIGHLLRRCYQHAVENTAEALRDLDVTPRQAVALQAIAQRGSMSQIDIGRAIGMEPANVHGLVDRLKTKRLIKVDADPKSLKRLRIGLTAAGREATRAIDDRLLQVEGRTLRNLDQSDRLHLVRLLRLLLA